MNRRGLLVIFGFALVLRLLVGLSNFSNPAASMDYDSDGYLSLARFLTEGEFPSTFRTPGYPLFLALTGSTSQKAVAATLMVQMVLDSATAVMLALVAWHLVRSSAAAALGGLAWAFCPVAILCSGEILTETLFAFFAVAGLLLALQPSQASQTALASDPAAGSATESPQTEPPQGARWWNRTLPNALVQGGCWVAMVMVRPSGLPLLGLLLLFVLVRPRFDPLMLAASTTGGASGDKRAVVPLAWPRQAAALALSLVCLAGWAAFNKQRAGISGLSTVADVATYTYVLPAVEMAHRVSWPVYARLWIASPAQGETLRQREEAAFLDEAFALPSRPPGRTRPASIFSIQNDPDAVRWLASEARARLSGRTASVLGTHVVGMLQVLRPLPPDESGGVLFSLLDGVRVLGCAVVVVLLARSRQWWLLSFLGLWVLLGLLMPGVCGVWRFRSFCEPAIALAYGITMAPLALRWAPARRALSFLGVSAHSSSLTLPNFRAPRVV